MKFTRFIAVLAFAALPFAAQAGVEVAPSKDIVPVIEPAPVYGVGSYWALQGGINAYQSYDGTKRRSFGTSNSYALEIKEKIGGFGGLKIGHVFGEGKWRSALELDGFYNGVDYEVQIRENGKAYGNESGRFDTGALLANYLLRADFGRFQPYVGGGIGGWVGSADDVKVTNQITGDTVGVGGGNNGGFAWQVVAGADYFITENMSIFTEYKWLNYENVDFGFGGQRVGQQLVGAGLRMFF